MQALLLLAAMPLLAAAQDAAEDEIQSETLIDVLASTEVLEPAPEQTVENWSDRAQNLLIEIGNFEKTSADADDLFLEVDRLLQTRVDIALSTMRRGASPDDPISPDASLPPYLATILDLHRNVVDLYSARLALLPHLSPDLHLEVKATDVIGMQQVSLEFRFIWEQFKSRALYLPVATEKLWRRVQIAPLPLIGSFIKFLLLIAIFVWWRRWLPETLRGMRASLAEIRPRSPEIMRRIRATWYVEQLRRPLEWLLFFKLLFAMFDITGLNFLLDIIAIVIRWVLLGWLAVSVLNAVAARGAAGLTGINAEVRLRSLRLVTAWLVLLGLGLNLAEDLAGVATLHAWVWQLFQLLALPVLLTLIAWWRQPIFAQLQRELDNNEPVEHLLGRSTGYGSYLNAAQGAIWLWAQRLRRGVLRLFLRAGAEHAISFGRRPAELLADASGETPRLLDAATRSALLTGEPGYERQTRVLRQNLIKRIERKQGGVIALVGERGIGKSALLQSLRAPLDGEIIYLKCKPDDFGALEQDLAKALSLQKVTPQEIVDGLRQAGTRVIAIDSLHRLSRPVIGGQGELTRLIHLIESVPSNILWILVIDCFSWQLMRRVRADHSLIDEVIDIPAWSEEQLAALIEKRSSDASVNADFSKVQIPAEHAVTTADTMEERNKAGVYRMLWAFSGGNPAVALHLWADNLYYDEQGVLYARTPTQPGIGDLDGASINILLTLRAIAQSEMITKQDIADNLRLSNAAVNSAVHFSTARGWIEESDGRYMLTMNWFRTITRTLARQNLLAR